MNITFGRRLNPFDIAMGLISVGVIAAWLTFVGFALVGLALGY